MAAHCCDTGFARAVFKQSVSYRRSAFSLDGAAHYRTPTRSLWVFRQLGPICRTVLESHAESAALFLLSRGHRFGLRLEGTAASPGIFDLATVVDPRDVRAGPPILS